jgi:hypothetical protein
VHGVIELSGDCRGFQLIVRLPRQQKPTGQLAESYLISSDCASHRAIEPQIGGTTVGLLSALKNGLS